MKLGARILLSHILVFGVGLNCMIYWVLNNMRVRYLEGTEDVLVDQANALAVFVGDMMAEDGFDPERMRRIFDAVGQRPLSAWIYKYNKTRADFRVYITDASGRALFDSEDGAGVGKDFSRWRDVYLTLRGQYGARTTRDDPEDPTSTVLYVAAPIRVNGVLAGTLTIGKPTAGINFFLESAKSQIRQAGVISVAAVILVSMIIVFWMTRPIRRLTQYADDVRQGRRAALPKLDNSEIGVMGKAFESMKETLEGKRYVENTIQTLTHEIKSPVSAIQGAAELLEEEMPAEQRARFLSNIRNESERIRKIVDRMLDLSALESRKTLPGRERIDLNRMTDRLIDAFIPAARKKELNLINQVDADCAAEGDAFLIRQALSNLIQNAVDFSPAGGRVRIAGRGEGEVAVISVEDEGPGIPDYALSRIFDKFYSLTRPGASGKSTGLGLNFVREAAEIHGGAVRVGNAPRGGVRAVLSLPCKQPPAPPA